MGPECFRWQRRQRRQLHRDQGRRLQRRGVQRRPRHRHGGSGRQAGRCHRHRRHPVDQGQRGAVQHRPPGHHLERPESLPAGSGQGGHRCRQWRGDRCCRSHASARRQGHGPGRCGAAGCVGLHFGIGRGRQRQSAYVERRSTLGAEGVRAGLERQLQHTLGGRRHRHGVRHHRQPGWWRQHDRQGCPGDRQRPSGRQPQHAIGQCAGRAGRHQPGPARHSVVRCAGQGGGCRKLQGHGQLCVRVGQRPAATDHPARQARRWFLHRRRIPVAESLGCPAGRAAGIDGLHQRQCPGLPGHAPEQRQLAVGWCAQDAGGRVVVRRGGGCQGHHGGPAQHGGEQGRRRGVGQLRPS
ncbi:hypothetical protein D3C81_1195250 [compost metagenome]